ncbi:MAG: shikimate dehydrogenase [Bacteroidales bacterium]|nr:shikimate dehydrogenase [Bacteroidales bacterium]
MKFGLIGYPLSHSFSQRYFSEKFSREGLPHSYHNFPVENIGLVKQLAENHPDLAGFNVTIPYKQQMIPFLSTVDEVALAVGAVNTVRVTRTDAGISLHGYNSDVYGFRRSLEESYRACRQPFPEKALVLGTGGASKAVIWVLRQLGIEPHFISRNPAANIYKTYSELNPSDIDKHLLIVNTTPLGMYPNTDACADIPYSRLTSRHVLFDLIYNPATTLFLQKGSEQGAFAFNGENMLWYQAEKAWEIWNNEPFFCPVIQSVG